MTSSKTFFLEELRFRAVRDPELLPPGTLVVMAHVPSLENGGFGAPPFANFSTIRAVREVPTVNELGFPEDVLKVFYFDKGGEHEAFAGDLGIVRYPAGHFNEANFLVVVEDLVTAGIDFELEVSEAYRLELRSLIYGDPVDEDPYDSYMDVDALFEPW